MALFDKFIKKDNSLTFTTKNFFIGSPEAEAESVAHSRMRLAEVFEDFLNVLPELQHEKFLITGRKGSGKSAIAEYISHLYEKEANCFSSFIRKSDINIERIAQLTQEHDQNVTQELIIEWVILTKLTLMLTSKESLQNYKEISDLQVFLKKNSGFIDIKSNQITQVVQSKGHELNVNYFKRFLTAKFGNKFDITKEKAPFYKLIPHLKATVLELMNYPENRENKFILIFDDLDIGFKSTSEKNRNTILNLIRVGKDYNNNFFGKNNLDSKIFILLRDDISRILYKYDADTAKLFSSYAVSLVWYEFDSHKRFDQEDKTKLKQFINKRLVVNFEKLGKTYNKNDPWSSFVENDPTYKKTSFKYIVDHTFARPRDLILFFSPISSMDLQLPLQKRDINNLLGKYSAELIAEVKNELSAHYSSEDIDRIFKALYQFSSGNEFSFQEFIELLKEMGFQEDSEISVYKLFEYSLIGNSIPDSNKVTFKFWEERDEVVKLNRDHPLVIHFAMKVYLANRKY
ncbi:hypothetical protein [Cyclobacterium sp.]|uniref:P-loop ATPase, Sll1717 family n=1 Tax=Cyclobacterium sp. TaxID=1966343 RepID=UPI0019843473|nr:hypothetical protein [Cyclobacterium sp.]MBD3630981.1 hypothetical protein [Cyclobacterium sp.]